MTKIEKKLKNIEQGNYKDLKPIGSAMKWKSEKNEHEEIIAELEWRMECLFESIEDIKREGGITSETTI